MADVPSPRSPDSQASQSTRQLLDELDALMQRMLALPVEKGENASEEKPEVAPAESPAAEAPRLVTGPRKVNLVPAASATVTVQSSSASKSAQVVVAKETSSKRETAKRQAEACEPESAPLYVPVGAEPLVPILLQRPKSAEKRTGVVLPPVLPPNIPSRTLPVSTGETNRIDTLPARAAWLKTPAATAPVSEPNWIMHVLLTVNRTFDRGTAGLGAAGRWLRGEQGRYLLGWSGIAMAVIAILWALLRFFG